MRAFFLVFILILIAASTCAGQKNKAWFYGEDKFARPVTLPVDVLRTLKNDAEVKRCVALPGHATLNPGPFSPAWFEATEVSLGKSGRSGLLVKATNGCLNGNAVSFWAFEKKGRKYDQVFYTYTLSLEIQKRTTRGYFNIWTGRCTANSCLNRMFAFNGRKYIRKREWWTPNG